MPTLETGQVFERYRINRWLGSGVSGESYEAEDSMLLRKVTLKLIHPQSTLPDSARRQFFREMQGISALNHAYLAPVLDYGEINGTLYVARKFVSSGSLLGTEGRLWFRSPLNIADAIHYTHQLAQTLHHIHSRGYLHGAVTFSNILVLRGPNFDNQPGYAPFILTDVGLANFVRRFGLQQQLPLPVTAAPEQLGKRVIPASDQFAMAVLLYFWLAGRPPYLGTPEEIEHLKLTETITPLSTINTRISIEQDGILLRALSVYAEDRYPSILTFADALLKTLPPKVVEVPSTEPGRFDEYTAQPSQSQQSEQPQQPQASAALAHEDEPIVAQPAHQEAQLAYELDGALPATPVLENETEESPIIEPESAPEFGKIPETDPVVSFEPPSQLQVQPEPAIMSEEDSPQQPIEPLPQTVPDVPQPLPEPVTPQPLPDPLPEKKPEQDTQPFTVAHIIISSPYAEQPYEIRLDKEEITIGRAGSSTILLDQDNLTSRHHALLKCEGNRYVLYDMRSANGVFVNGQKIAVEKGYELIDGDHISIGNYELIFRISVPDGHEAYNGNELKAIPDYEVSNLI